MISGDFLIFATLVFLGFLILGETGFRCLRQSYFRLIFSAKLWGRIIFPV
jgi:hypothetical protein